MCERPPANSDLRQTISSRRQELVVLAIAAVIFLTGIISPPSLMDDVDAAQSSIARTMLTSGDWVTARLDGVVYLEKAPLKYWLTAISYMIFGVHDWAARIPGALAAILLCWVVFRFGRWAFSERVGFYAGLVTATCIGLFLFTRIVIPDVMVTLAVAVAIWSFLRALDEDERRPRLWAYLLAVALAVGVLLKGLIGIVFPLGAGFIYLLLTRQLFSMRTWRRLYPFTSTLVFLVIALPWHVLATLRNPPYFDLTLHSTPFVWRGFFWFYFINEHVLRFLNERYPRDYNTVPRLYFWLFHVIWFFPWTAYLPATLGLGYRPVDRGSRTRLMALCWIGFVMLFFTLSTTQEYYSMPIYPAVALLIGCGIARESAWVARGGKIIAIISTALALTLGTLLVLSWNLPAPGDISRALTQNPDVYTLSMGHMLDLTLGAFAYLRLPLAVAGVAFGIGALAAWSTRGDRVILLTALVMVMFFQAVRLALVVFDPYLSSRPIAEAIQRSPKGTVILADEYYTFSSVLFYTDSRALLLNGRKNNLEYGSYAPGAPSVFIDDQEFVRRWRLPARCYLLADQETVPRMRGLVGDALWPLAAAGGKQLFANQPTAGAAPIRR